MDNINSFIYKVKSTIDLHQMLADHQSILVGVSGGPDSMALLSVLAKLYPGKVIAAHLNHMFRGEEAVEDANFVKEECLKMDIPSIIEKIDVPLYIKQTGLGAQEAARQIRYQFYLDAANSTGATHIALGHHANDQAETVLMRLLRGTGTYGLSGIPYTRDFGSVKIVRPFLDITRVEIENYCQQNAILFRIDKSNLSPKYFRNDIRLNVIPYLEKYNENLIAHLHHLAKMMQDESAYFTKIAEDFLKKNNIDLAKNEFRIDIYSLKNLDLALQRRVIHLILRYLNVHNELAFLHIESIIQLINHRHPSKSLDLPKLRVYRDYDNIIFTTIGNNLPEPFKYTVQIPGNIVLSVFNKRIKYYLADNYLKPKGPWEAVFDYDKLKDNKLTIRSRIIGDKMSLFGMDGSKKLKDILIDQKIPRNRRDIIPVIENSGEILWVPGVKRSNHALVTEQTKKYLYFIVEEL